MSANFLPQNCQFYWVSLNQVGAPILGTMRAKNNNQYDKNNGHCTEARLTPYQMVAPAGHTQCFFKSGFRYFYLFDNIKKSIVPNSMIQVSRNNKPKQMCIGTSSYLEYINFNPAPVNTIAG